MKQVGQILFPETIAECSTWKPPVFWRSLDTTVLCAATTRFPGSWCAYICSVAGVDHKAEAWGVLANGTKMPAELASMLFHQFAGVPYAD